jgi:hypothetical protein
VGGAKIPDIVDLNFFHLDEWKNRNVYHENSFLTATMIAVETFWFELIFTDSMSSFVLTEASYME